MRASLRRALESLRLPFQVGVEASGAKRQLSLVARGSEIGLVASDLSPDSHGRDQLKVLSVSDIKVRGERYRVQCGDVAGSLSSRVEVPLTPVLSSLHDPPAKQHGSPSFSAGRPSR